MKKSFDIKEYLKENKITVGKDDGMNIKDLITEAKGNPDTLADIFARFLIGDRKAAIRQLQGEIKNEFGVMETPGTEEYNNQYRKLVDGFSKVIKSTL